jgi:galactose mutarotase-like enzyme
MGIDISYGGKSMVSTIKNDKIEVSVKSYGAEMTSLKTVEDNLEFLWQGDPKFWKGQSYTLFPIIGGLVDDQYELDGKMFSMKAHGFARNTDFELVKETGTELVYKITDTAETLVQYPYKFEFYVTYKLEENTLKHGFEVKNLDLKEMLFSVGAHPGFNCPLYPGEEMKDYKLVFEKEEKLERRLKVGPTLSGDKLPFMNEEKEKQLDHSLFYNGAVIMDSLRSEWLEIRNSKNDRVIRVDFPGFPYLGIWSAANNGPYVCIEPWYGVDSTAGDSYDLTKKEGAQRLAPGNSFRCEYSITLK